ncbi:MAG: sugar porter family MFS transporter [Pseudomonadota bacterium]
MLYNKYKSFGLALLVSLGGFIFGFDASVISGAIGLISTQYALGPLEQGLVVGSPTLGAIIAACVVGYLTDRYGRKKILLLIAFLYAISIVGSALANGYIMLVVCRFIGGLAFASLMVAPLYIAEITPAALRGKYVSFNQLNIVAGFSAAYFSNFWLLSSVDTDASWVVAFSIKEYLWRWMLGLEIAPALIYFFLLFYIPESPRWLILNNRKEEARQLLNKLVPPDEVDEQLLIPQENLDDAHFIKKLRSLFNSRTRFILMVGIVVGIIQQATGVNAIYFYAPTIFEQSGIGTNAAFAQAVWIGVVNIIFTLIAIATIDRFGRKPLMIIGLLGVMVSMGLCGYGFSQAKYQLTAQNIPSVLNESQLESIKPLLNVTYLSDVDFKQALRAYLGSQFAKQYESELLKSATQINSNLILLGILGFVAAFAISLGPVMWVLLSEIFPNNVRGIAIAFVGVMNSFVSFLVQVLFPWQLENMGSTTTFIIYGIFAILGFAFVVRYLPETKGKTLEQLEQSLVNKHF